MVYPHDGIVFGHKKEWNSDICSNMDGPWKYYAKWNKLDTKGIFYVSIYMNRQIYRDKSRLVFGCN